jgi:hypothetical protein
VPLETTFDEIVPIVELIEFESLLLSKIVHVLYVGNLACNRIA